MSRVQKVSIRDLAVETGFSPMTVSRALRNSPQVNANTKDKIRSAADRLGYSMNPLVAANMAAIRSRRSVNYQATLAILHQTPPGGHWVITRRVLDGLKARAEETGFSCDAFDLADPDIRRANLARILKSRGIQGVIQTPMSLDLHALNIDFSDLTIVSCDPGSLPQRLHRVCPDYYGNMDMLLKRIHSNGYTRIGLLLAKDFDLRLNHLMTSRFLAFQQTEDLPKIPIFMPENRDDYDPSDLRSWFDVHKPDVIISTADTNFRDKLFEKAAINYPTDVKIVKVNINRQRKGISGINEESEEVGATAVNTLANLLFQNQTGIPEKPISVLVPGKWTDG